MDRARDLESLEVIPKAEVACELWIDGAWIPATEGEAFSVPALGMEGAVFFSCRDTAAESEFGVSPLFVVAEHGSGSLIPTGGKREAREDAVKDALKFFLASPNRSQAWEMMKALAQSRRVNL